MRFGGVVRVHASCAVGALACGAVARAYREGTPGRAKETTIRARAELGIPELPPNDYLLGWQDTQGLYRYCHHFDEPEIERLLAMVADSADLVSRFEADGKTGNLNEYVVLRVK